MKRIGTLAIAALVAAALLAPTGAEARNGRIAAGIVGGLAAGALFGAAIGSGGSYALAAAREDFERQYIVSVLTRVEGSRTEASRILGLSRKALWEKCKRYGIPSERNGQEDEDEQR